MGQVRHLSVDDMAPVEKIQRDNRPEYLKAKERSISGIVCTCPFGCSSPDDPGSDPRFSIDDKGVCWHLVGGTHGCQPGEVPRVYEPLVRKKRGKGADTTNYFTDGGNWCLIQDDDVLVRVTTCFRVYSDNPNREHIPAGDLPRSDAEENESLRTRVRELEAIVTG